MSRVRLHKLLKEGGGGGGGNDSAWKVLQVSSWGLYVGFNARVYWD